MVEILVVITIIVILAGLVLGGITVATSNKDKVDTKNTLMTLTIAIEKYKKDNGRYPTWAEIKAFDNTLISVDSWGNDIDYILSSAYSSSTTAQFRKINGTDLYYNPTSFQLISAGEDKNIDTPNDNVTNFEVQ